MSLKLSSPSNNPRHLALRIVSNVLDAGVHLQAALDRELSSTTLAHKDSSLCTELSYGYLRRLYTCSFLINQFLSRPKKLPPSFVRLLGLCCYELVFLDRIPFYASINCAVDLSKKLFGHTLSRVANGVLRRISEIADQASAITYYQKCLHNNELISTYYSLPADMVQLLVTSIPSDDLHAYLEASLKKPHIGVRINASQPENAGLREKLCTLPGLIEYNNYGLAFDHSPKILDQLVSSGRLSKQSFSSYMAVQSIPESYFSEPLLDLCCGRGGKTTVLLERGYQLVASDFSFQRLRQLPSECKRLSVNSPFILQLDASSPLPFKTRFKTVLIDAPCSGLGVISRRPDSKYRMTPETISVLNATQMSILENALTCVEPGGRILYITCSILPSENEHLIQSLLSNHSDLDLVLEQRPDYSSISNEYFYTAVLLKTA